jgi:hypothetical protein
MPTRAGAHPTAASVLFLFDVNCESDTPSRTQNKALFIKIKYFAVLEYGLTFTNRPARTKALNPIKSQSFLPFKEGASNTVPTKKQCSVT